MSSIFRANEHFPFCLAIAFVNSTSESGFRVSSIQTKLRERSVCTNAVPSLHFSFLLEQCALVLREDISYRNLLAKRRFITARPFKGEEREREIKKRRELATVTQPLKTRDRFRILCGACVCVFVFMCRYACYAVPLYVVYVSPI